MRTARARSSSGYLFPKFFFSITQYPYFWVSGKQGAIQFETPVDFQRFVELGYDASVDAGAMQGEERDKAEVQFTEGRTFFVLGKKGWRVNANAKGTRYWKDKKLN